MSLFGDQAIRLLREKWKNPVQLAEELYAMFTSSRPLTTDAPITIFQSGDQPPLRIVMNSPDPGVLPIQVFRPDPVTGVSGYDPDAPSGGVTIDGGGNPVPTPGGGNNPAGGGTDLGGIDWPEATDPENVPPPAENPIVLWGQVVSGSGETYQVKVWGKPPSSFGPMGVLTCTVGQIDPEEAVPAGTFVVVVAFPDGAGGIAEARFQPPVWLPGEE